MIETTPEFPDELKAAAAEAPGGWVYAIDPAYDPRGRVPPEGVAGAWKIGNDGRPTGEFTPNPNYVAQVQPASPANSDGDPAE
ncbi:MAG: hypothetical protein ACT4OM_07545 [Actinomycetota bacterium]